MSNQIEPDIRQAIGLISSLRNLGTYAQDQRLELLSQTSAALMKTITRIQEAEFDGNDGTGLVSATMSGGGELRSVRISAAAMSRLSSNALGSACKDAIRMAQYAVSDATRGLLSGIVPDGGGVDRPPTDIASVKAAMLDKAITGIERANLAHGRNAGLIGPAIVQGIRELASASSNQVPQEEFESVTADRMVRAVLQMNGELLSIWISPAAFRKIDNLTLGNDVHKAHKDVCEKVQQARTDRLRDVISANVELRRLMGFVGLAR